jgi:murein L,D-transpeptidase YafK
MRLRFPARLIVCAVLLYLPSYVIADDRLPTNARADRLLGLKKERKLMLVANGKTLKTYGISLGGNPAGPKTREGDHKTPEGMYVLDRRNPKSRFYRSIHISYPSPQDSANAHTHGVAPGGEIMIHGLPNGYGWLRSTHRLHDWTDGCIAVTNGEMDEIWRAVPMERRLKSGHERQA